MKRRSTVNTSEKPQGRNRNGLGSAVGESAAVRQRAQLITAAGSQPARTIRDANALANA